MTPDPTDGWRARLVDDPQTFSSDAVRLLLHRSAGPDVALTLTELSGGSPVQVTYERGTWPETDDQPFNGLWLPRGVAEAIAEAVNPGPSRAELNAVREALQVERMRVQQVLDARMRVGPA